SGGGADREKYRFNWNSPILMSHANPDVLYYAGNVVFKTTDGGATWSVISPDLTTNDPEKQKLSGGPINPDNTRAEFHCTILALAESPRDANVLWAGTDDGNVQLTRDGGSTWTNVTPPDAPKSSWVAAIHTSHRDPGSAYLAIDQHRLDDFAPHAFVTHDYGRTWKRISQGLRGYVHIVMEDPKQPSLLYAGTELGIWASFDRGATWTDLRLGLPPLSVVDMKVHPRDNDLVIATHARGFYILDDITPLQNLAAARAKQATLFPPLRATRYVPASDTSSLGDRVWVAKNKPYGASLSFYMAKAGPASLTILDGDGRELRTLETRAAAGVNRAVWNLEPRGCGPGLRAPRVLPGQYKVRLNALGEISEQPLTVRLDPRLTVSDADLKVYGEQVALLHQTQCAISAMQADIRKAVAANHPQRAELERIGNALNSPPRDPEHENIFRKLAWLVDQVGGCTCRPTAAQIEWIGRFADATRDYRTQLDAILKRVN
ncbi:MAG TPA: hypothetical protein DEH78_00470, partial [Solibacterales bacterium]|nr:hypothetical protein [Bryobacterales bacterium]